MLAREEHTQHAIRQLQRQNISLVAGAANAVNIAVAGITVGAEIISVIHNTAGALVDLTAEAAVTSDGNIQLTTTDTTGDQLLVFWLPAPNTLSV